MIMLRQIKAYQNITGLSNDSIMAKLNAPEFYDSTTAVEFSKNNILFKSNFN